MTAVIGPYRVVRTLGAGGWSTVYEVLDADGRPWALKRLRDDLGADALARFQREVASLGRIDHPGVVRLIDAGVDGAAPYLVTPVLDGATMRTALGDGALVPEAAVALVIAAAHAVAAIHAAGLVHRDLKPENLVLTADGAVVVIDLGLALGPEHSRHTAEDTLTGSVPYMAPEQIEDGEPSPASDVWALGVVLFEALAGRRPFQRRRGSEEVAAILAGRAPALVELAPAVSEGLAAVVARCLDPDPLQRPRDGAALARALEACVDWIAPALLADERAAWRRDPRAYRERVATVRVRTLAAEAEAALAAGDRFAATRSIERGLGYRAEDAGLAALLDRVMGGRAQAQTIRGAAPAPAGRVSERAAVTDRDREPDRDRDRDRDRNRDRDRDPDRNRDRDPDRDRDRDPDRDRDRNRDPDRDPDRNRDPDRALPAVRARWRWWLGGSLAAIVIVGVVAARPWRSRATPSTSAPAAVRTTTAPRALPPTTGETRPAHVPPTTGETRRAHVIPSQPQGVP